MNKFRPVQLHFMMSTFTKCPWPCLHLRGCIGKKSISLILMKYLLLYQWPLRPCRNHLNPNMMLAKNLLRNNLMYVLINSSPSNFFFLWYWDYFNLRQNQTHVMSTSITVEWWIYNGINARTFHSNCDVQILAQKGHTLYICIEPVSQYVSHLLDPMLSYYR